MKWNELQLINSNTLEKYTLLCRMKEKKNMLEILYNETRCSIEIRLYKLEGKGVFYSLLYSGGESEIIRQLLCGIKWEKFCLFTSKGMIDLKFSRSLSQKYQELLDLWRRVFF